MKIIEYIEDFNEKDVYVLKQIRGYKSNCYYVRFKCYEDDVLFLTNIKNNSIIYEILPIRNLEYQHGNTSDNYIIAFCSLNPDDTKYKICLSDGYLIKEKSKYRQIIAQMNMNLPKELIEYIQTFI
jgi:Zn/Cd-binding protein ZinT